MLVFQVSHYDDEDYRGKGISYPVNHVGCVHTDVCVCVCFVIQADRQADRQTDRQTDIQTDRQTDRQTDTVRWTYIDTQTHI